MKFQTPEGGAGVKGGLQRERCEAEILCKLKGTGAYKCSISNGKLVTVVLLTQHHGQQLEQQWV